MNLCNLYKTIILVIYIELLNNSSFRKIYFMNNTCTCTVGTTSMIYRAVCNNLDACTLLHGYPEFHLNKQEMYNVYMYMYLSSLSHLYALEMH